MKDDPFKDSSTTNMIYAFRAINVDSSGCGVNDMLKVLTLEKFRNGLLWTFVKGE